MKNITKILLFLLLVVLLLVVLLHLLVVDTNTTVALPYYVKIDSSYWMFNPPSKLAGGEGFIGFDLGFNILCNYANLSCLHTGGNHTLSVQRGLNIGVGLFIVSEALFFLSKKFSPGLEWALHNPPKPHAFTSLPLQSLNIRYIYSLFLIVFIVIIVFVDDFMSYHGLPLPLGAL